MPTCSLSQLRSHTIFGRGCSKLYQRQNLMDDMRRRRMTCQMFFHKTDRITRFLFCWRHSNFHVMGALWAVVSCLVWPQLTAECSQCCLLPRGVRRCPASPCHAQSDRSTVVIRKAPPVLMAWCGGAPRKTQKPQNKHHDSGKAASPDYILFARPLTMPT